MDSEAACNGSFRNTHIGMWIAVRKPGRARQGPGISKINRHKNTLLSSWQPVGRGPFKESRPCRIHCFGDFAARTVGTRKKLRVILAGRGDED